jgi:hypothetical protein
VVEGGAVDVREFRDDDAGYRTWLGMQPDGYVLNVLRSYSRTGARIHHAGCWTINAEKVVGKVWTEQYVKVCAEDLTDLRAWAADQVGKPVPPCGTCHPFSQAVSSFSSVVVEPAVAGHVPEDHWEVHGPLSGDEVVKAWAADYIRFQDLPDWQKKLLVEIKTRCGQLTPSDEQILHATFYGAKRHNADVENLVLYNISTFKTAGRNGIRFEHGEAVPPAPAHIDYPFSYRYALAPRPGGFKDWQEGRRLASFEWTDLGAFAGERKLAQVWLALCRGEVEVQTPCAPGALFAVKVEIRPPQGCQPVWGELVKGVFDGAIAAFQAHTDTAILPDVAALLAKVLPADPVEIEHHLVDQTRAVLGVVPRLVKPFRVGVQWQPSDHWCVAGELLAAETAGERWSICGEIVEVSR